MRGLATEPDGAVGVVTTAGDLLRIGTDVDAAVRRIDRGRRLRGQPYRVRRAGDSLWIGTTAGLFHIRLGSGSRMEVERVLGAAHLLFDRAVPGHPAVCG